MHPRPCAKCAKICTARKFLRLQYTFSYIQEVYDEGFYLTSSFFINDSCLNVYYAFVLVMELLPSDSRPIKASRFVERALKVLAGR